MTEFTLEFGKLNNKQDPLRLGVIDFKTRVITSLTQLQNFDVDNNDLATCRDGRVEVYSGTPHSFWVHPFDDSVAYFVEASVLKKLNADFTATTVTTLSNNFPVFFELVGMEVVISNGVDIGWVLDTDFTAFSQTTGQFERLMPAGQILAYDHGDNVLLVASDGVLYKSKPHNAEVRDERLDKFPFDGHIRMVAAVEDGWWIATEKRVGFVIREEDDEYAYTHVSDNPPAEGGFTAGWEKTESGSRRYVTWASLDGFIEGRASGQFRNLSEGIALPEGTTGKVFARNNNGTDQYIAVIVNPVDIEKFTPPVMAVNTITIPA